MHPWGLVLASLALAACGGATTPPVEVPEASPRVARGTVTLPPEVEAGVVVSWLEPELLADPARGFEAVIAAGAHALVLPADSTGTVPFELPVAGGPEVHLVAWLAPPARGVFAMYARPGAVSPPVDLREETRVELTLEAPEEPPPAEERCVGERVELFELPAPRGTAGGDETARLCAYLPADYEEDPARRYPVIYSLPGMGGSHAGGVAELLRTLLDLGNPPGDAIVVGVDTSTPTGASYLVDSPITGPWADYVTRDVIAAVDGRLRTLPERDHRAVVGHSTGGFNAVSIALRRPEVWGTIAASSPDALDFASWLLDASGRRAQPVWQGWIHTEDALGWPGQLISYAVEWSPDAAAPRGFRWPIDLRTGEVIDEVWARWLAESPVTWLDDDEGLARARRFDDHLYLTCGRPDEPLLFVPTERFHEALDRVGITHTWEPTELRHQGSVPDRFESMLRYVMARIGES